MSLQPSARLKSELYLSYTLMYELQRNYLILEFRINLLIMIFILYTRQNLSCKSVPIVTRITVG